MRLRPSTPGRPGRRTASFTLIGALFFTACGVERGVETIGATPTPSDRTAVGADDDTPTDDGVLTDGPDDSTPVDDVDDAPLTTAPPDLPPIVEPELAVEIALEDVIDVGGDKPSRAHDDFVAVSFTDIERWWGEQYPEVYDEEFEPLAGGIYAGYPERDEPLPGCGEPSTAYRDLVDFVAFYCEFDDFMVYDDGNTERSLLTPLAEEFGPAVMGIVLAHEYGHVIQQRIGALDRFLATIVTEQQADCFAGAWTGQAYRGESPLLRLGDRDVRAGLIAMLSVRDPVGTDQFVPGGHGSAFDRVGAFQVGFNEGPARCAELIDDPLPLMPNEFQRQDDFVLGGNAPYFCEDLREFGATEEQIADCSPAPVFLADDLDDFWTIALGSTTIDLEAVAVSDIARASCGDAVVLADEVVLCPAARQVVYDEPAVLELYREFGDFTLGYFYGIAWSEYAQQQLESELSGEDRALLNDCLVGAWVRDITPDEFGSTPRERDTDGDGEIDFGVSSSPGDLDEAIRMAIIEGDEGANVDQVGSPFEKIDAFRTGVLGGLDACSTLID